MIKMYIAVTVILLVVSVTGVLSRGPPVITAPIQPRFTGKLGEVIRFICPIRGDPEPILEWYRDGERVMEFWDRYRLLNKGSSLNIKRLECEDQGTYVCKAINGFGVHEISFQLDLLNDLNQEACINRNDKDDATSIPMILHKSKRPKSTLKPGGNWALLKCTAVAEPLPKFHWFKDGMEIIADKGQPTGAKYAMRSTVLSEEDLTEFSEVSEMEGLRSTLQISDLKGSDTANYTCRAQNQHGWDEMTQILEVVERQVPKRPEMHPEFPPVHTWVEMGQAGSLSCKVASEFPAEVHWLKRITPTPGSNNIQPPAPDETEVENMNSQFVVNKTIIIGNIKYQILPSAPAKLLSDNYYTSILLLSKKCQEADSGYYVCVALNNAGYNYRQVYLNVTTSNLIPYHTTDDNSYSSTTSEGWGDKSRADATTTAVVVVVVVCGLAAMVASCLVWKRRKNHLKDKTLNVPARSCSSVPEAIVVQQPTQVAQCPSVLDYSKFRDGLSSNISGTPPASNSSRSDPVIPIPHGQPHPQPQPEFVPPRVYYMARTPCANSPRQQKIMQQQQQQRTKLSSASGRSGSGSRQHHHRSSPKSTNHHYHNPAQYHHHRQPAVPAEARSLTTDTSFHSESFYPDWSAYPHHIRLLHPSPESSFDQL